MEKWDIFFWWSWGCL